MASFRIGAAKALLALLTAVASTSLADVSVTRTATLDGVDNIAAVVAAPEAKVYVVQGARLLALNSQNLAVTSSIPLPGPAIDLAISKTQAMVLLADGGIVVVDLERGSIEAQIPSTVAAATNISFDQATGAFLMANHSGGSIYMLDSSGSRVEVIDVPASVTKFVSNARGWLFAVAAGSGAVHVVDIENRTSLGSFDVPDCGSLVDIVVDDKERRLYANCDDQDIVSIDSDTGVILNRLQTSVEKGQIAILSTRDRAIEVLLTSSSGSYQLATGRITANLISETDIEIGEPTAMASDEQGAVYVAQGNQINVIRND